MARYIGPNCRLCRREGMKLFLKGNKCTSNSCPFTKRQYAPGEHGNRRVKFSNYALQLREKQKAKRIYGILERQFRRYFQMAAKARGVTGKILLQYLERRLDNVIFQSQFATSRSQARQIVKHRCVFVNNRLVDIPSYLVKKDDIIQIKENKQKFIRKNIEDSSSRSIPVWLEVDSSALKLKVLRLPEREEIQLPIQEHLIVELYSK